MGLTSEFTTFSLDNQGRFLCNTLQEAVDSASIVVGGEPRGFDVVVIGGGTFGAVMASELFLKDTTHSRRILVLEAGPFTLPEHMQNLPYQGGAPDFRAPWDSHPGLGYPGLLYTVGGRSLAWGGWSPELLPEEMEGWPQSVISDLRNTYFRQASDQIGVTDTNDFIFGRLHVTLRRQLFEGLQAAGRIPHAIPLGNLPDHAAVKYAAERLGFTMAAAAAAAAPTMTTAGGVAVPDDERLRDLLGLEAGDHTSRADMRNMMKLEAPLAVQARTAPGLFPFNKYSAVPTLIRAARIASSEAKGIDASGDARKRLMIVPQCKVLDIITETQPDHWVRVTGVRVKDKNGSERVIPLSPPRDGQQCVVVVALGTIESTRLALNTFKDSLSRRAAQRMGKNLMAHLRSNLTVRLPVSALRNLPPSERKGLEASALFVKGKTNVAGKDRFFHLQITASGLGKLGDDSEAELFRKIPDIEHLEAMLNATDTHVVLTIRGIGQMSPQNPDSFIRLSGLRTEDGRPVAEVTLADVKFGSSTTPESRIDQQVWEAMDTLADEVALVFANNQPFEVLGAKGGRTLSLGANATIANLQAAHPHADRRDPLGTTHHDAGTLWMGGDPATSVTNDFGRIHDTPNCYVATPALFPTTGSPNPMLTGVALCRRTADMLTAQVLPRPALRRAEDQGFTALFDGTTETFKLWKLAGRQGGAQNFAFINGELVSYGAADIALLHYAQQTFGDFHLRLQFKIFDPNSHNSGVFLRFPDPFAPLPAVLQQRADREGIRVADNPAFSAVVAGFEIQIDDNARGDQTKDFYGRRPEPDGLWKNRTGAIYKIPAGDFIFHLGRHDARLQEYVPGPPLVPNVWFQYDIVVRGNRFEVTLTDTETKKSQLTTIYENTDGQRGVTPGCIGIQSYPNNRITFRDIWIK